MGVTGSDALGDCGNCETGRYQGATGRSKCELCAAGFAQGATGQTACETCLAGYAVGASQASVCAMCGVGYYAPAAQAVTCTGCETGKFQDAAASSACKLCPGGLFRNTGIAAHAADGSQCFPCAPGFFTAAAGAHSVCTECPIGKVQPVSGATGCVACNWGKYMDAMQNTVCKQCPEGRYEDSGGGTAVTQCKACIVGHSCPSKQMTAPSPCALGTYQAAALQLACGECPTGRVAPTTGLSTCAACAVGKLQGATGRSQCDDCAAGTYAGVTALSVCADCGLGKFTATSGLSVCSACVAGRFADAEGLASCKLCMQGKHQDDTGMSLCKGCAAGKYSVDAVLGTPASHNVHCRDCAAGTAAGSTDSSTCSDCLAGWYVGTTGAAVCIPCNYGTFTARTGSASCATCPAGRFSSSKQTVQCAACGSGTYSRDAAGGNLALFYRNMYCIPCPPGTVSSGLVTSKVSALQAAVVTSSTAGSAVASHGSLLDMLGFTGETSSGAFPSAPAQVALVQAASVMPSQAFIQRLAVDTSGLLNTAASALSGYHPLLGRVNGEGCMMCTPGRHKPTFGLSACANCGNGKYQPGHGHIQCEVCALGKYTATVAVDGSSRGLTTGATHCWDCPGGRYADRTGESTCLQCPVGHIASGAGQLQCTACPAGQFVGDVGKSTCEPCPAGRFTLIVGQSVCVQCSAGTYMGGTGATVCTACPVGRVAADAEATVCAHCPNGAYVGLPGQSACQACSAGRYTNQLSILGTGASECTDCARGYYAAGASTSTCTAAEAGRYVLYPGRSATEQCAPGTYTPFGQTASVGPYDAGAPGETRCRQCLPGTYCNEQGHNLPSKPPPSCPAGRWGAQGLTHHDCSGECPPGYLCPDGTPDSAKRSTPCGRGFFCPAGSGSSGIAVTTAHYCTQPQSDDVLQRWTTCQAQARCEPGFYCTEGARFACPAGSWQPNVGKTSIGDCSARQCSAGYFCPEGSTADKVQPCAPDGAAHPAKYYCPAGTAVRREASDYVSASSRGQYTNVDSPATHRQSALGCATGDACWSGLARTAVAFSSDSCPSGTLRVQVATVASGSVSLSVPIAMSPVSMAVQTHVTAGAPVPATSALAFSLGGFSVPGGCTASNPFAISSLGVLAIAAGATLSPLTCPVVSVEVAATTAGNTVTCTVIASVGAEMPPQAPSIAAGVTHACYLTAPASPSVSWGGDVACFGASGDISGKILNAAHATVGWVQVATGSGHTCGLKASGELACAGVARGNGIGTEHIWTSASAQEKFLSIAATDDFTCAVSAGTEVSGVIQGRHTLQCRGGNTRLSSGFGVIQGQLQGVAVATVALGPEVGCMLLAGSGSLLCFGAGAGGFLAQTPLGAFSALAVGDTGNACALRVGDGHLVCWGSLWGGSSYTYSTAYSAVAVGSQWLCAVRRDAGVLQCFGMYVPAVFANYGALPPAAVAQVSARGDMLCLLFTSGAPACYGGVARSGGGNAVASMSAAGQPAAVLLAQ